ncbi:MAG: hypothetical protein ACI90E_001125, partial [Yoonia sp.]
LGFRYTLYVTYHTDIASLTRLKNNGHNVNSTIFDGLAVVLLRFLTLSY